MEAFVIPHSLSVYRRHHRGSISLLILEQLRHFQRGKLQLYRPRCFGLILEVDE